MVCHKVPMKKALALTKHLTNAVAQVSKSPQLTVQHRYKLRSEQPLSFYEFVTAAEPRPLAGPAGLAVQLTSSP